MARPDIAQRGWARLGMDRPGKARRDSTWRGYERHSKTTQGTKPTFRPETRQEAGSMKVATLSIHGISPYSQSQRVTAPKAERETHDEYERRTWPGRMHVVDGEVVIPPMAIKNCLDRAAKSLSIPIPGKGKSTYTRPFESGVMVVDAIPLGIKAEDVPGEELFVPSDGIRGSGKRVTKWFPRIDTWGGEATVYIIDDIISREVFETVLTYAGKLVGLGRFRPETRGFYGRFEAEITGWEEQA